MIFQGAGSRKSEDFVMTMFLIAGVFGLQTLIFREVAVLDPNNGRLSFGNHFLVDRNEGGRGHLRCLNELLAQRPNLSAGRPI